MWPRAVIYDLYCDTSGEEKSPEFSYEYPALTYRCNKLIVFSHTSNKCH